MELSHIHLEGKGKGEGADGQKKTHCILPIYNAKTRTKDQPPNHPFSGGMLFKIICIPQEGNDCVMANGELSENKSLQRLDFVGCQLISSWHSKISCYGVVRLCACVCMCVTRISITIFCRCPKYTEIFMTNLLQNFMTTSAMSGKLEAEIKVEEDW